MHRLHRLVGVTPSFGYDFWRWVAAVVFFGGLGTFYLLGELGVFEFSEGLVSASMARYFAGPITIAVGALTVGFGLPMIVQVAGGKAAVYARRASDRFAVGSIVQHLTGRSLWVWPDEELTVALGGREPRNPTRIFTTYCVLRVRNQERRVGLIRSARPESTQWIRAWGERTGVRVTIRDGR